MSPYHIKQKDKKRKNLFRKWHRRIGFTAAIFLLNLAVTGILLNHSDDLELVNEAIRLHFKNPSKLYELDYRMRHKSGKYIWVRARGSTGVTPDGTRYFAGCHRDITNIKKKEELYLQIIDAIPHFVFVKDRDRCFTFVNQSLATAFGQDKESIRGKGDIDFIKDEKILPPDQDSSRRILADQILEILEDLSPKERKILSMRNGLEDGIYHTLEEVGKEFGVTRERIRQIEAKALEKIRQHDKANRLKNY